MENGGLTLRWRKNCGEWRLCYVELGDVFSIKIVHVTQQVWFGRVDKLLVCTCTKFYYDITRSYLITADFPNRVESCQSLILLSLRKKVEKMLRVSV